MALASAFRFSFRSGRIFLWAALVLTFSSVKVYAQADDSTVDSIIIRNVYLLSQEDTAHLKVSLVLVDKRLELVATDDITDVPDARVYDGQGGFLMGRLIIGEAPNFVVLRENPGENFDIFLNTKDYVVFAMEDGEMVINNLHLLKMEEEEKDRRRFTWTAYNPPPMAVPFNYYSSKKWNKFDTKWVSGLFNGILALDRMSWVTQDENSKSQVGELDGSSLGEVRAMRFGLIGSIHFKRPWSYTFFVASNAFDRDYDDGRNALILYDLRVDIPIFEGITMSIGRQKEPISMSRLTTLVFLPMQERQAAEDAFLPARNYGIVFNKTYLDGRGTWALGAFKNFIDSDTTFGETPTQITGRVTGVPYLSDDGSNLVHVGAGLRFSDARQPVVARTEAEFFLSPVFVETPEITANHFFTYDLELYWRKGPLLLGGEYVGNIVKAPDEGDPFLYGFNIVGAWAITGEMRPYRRQSGIFDPLRVSKPVGQGGGGALELALRYSLIDLNDNEVQGGKMRTTSAGVNWWPSPHVQVSCNYRFVSLDRFKMKGNSSGMNIRLMLILD